jgi:sigma-B regulation protein RsbU (phosphoserine phosphatase)
MTTELGSLLVVDDNESNREGLSRLLRLHGYTVTVGKDGRQALDLVGRQRFDLVLLDIMMLGLDGMGVLKCLRANHSATDLPVIMTTALDQSEDIVKALKSGANDYVTKPIDFAVLLARIQTQLSLKRAVERVMRLEQNLTQRNEELEAANSKLRAVNARMKENLAAAARIQEAFLPPDSSRFSGARCAWLFRPCEELAGDMLNVFPLDADHLGLYVLDVSGHGVAAALLSVTLSHLLTPRREPTSLLTENGEDGEPRVVPPAEVAARLNRRFTWDAATEQFFTLIYGVLHLRTGELRFVAAGHPGPVYVPGVAEPVRLTRPGLPIGIGGGAYPEHSLLLRPGDRLYFYSDGLAEVMNAGRETFGKHRLLACLDRCRGLDLNDSLSVLWQDVQVWREGGPQKDDVSVLALEFAETPARKVKDRPCLEMA